MALDRHKILTELGSVISQLKNADCGCMGKLFENNRRMPIAPSHHYETFCSHRPNCSECSHNMASNAHKNMHLPCMAGCNAPKLYSDTCNYLSENMIKPVVQEVYDDLKSITPANTIVNNPAAMNQMGLNGGWQGGQSVDAQGAGAHPLKNSNYQGQNAVPLNNRHINYFGGMGPQIMNMIQGNNANTAHQDGQIAKPLMFDSSQLTQNQNVVTSPPTKFVKHHNMEQSNPTSQFMKQPSLAANTPRPNITNIQPPNLSNINQHSYGQHTQGIAKFNEMFPTLVKNDLGYDPMSIAIQMNPANQKQGAVQAIHDMVYKKNVHGQDNNNNVNNLLQSQTKSNMPIKPMYYENPPVSNELNFVNQPFSNNMHGSRQMPIPNENMHNLDRDQTNYQVYSGPKDTSATNQHQQMQYELQNVVNADNPNIAAVVDPSFQALPSVSENNQIVYNQTASNVCNRRNFQNINEAIYPVDTTENITRQNYGYNTLGQPVKMLPANSYHTPVPSLPQTLSPQPTMKYNHGHSKYSNVKSTVSKTSLLANRSIGKTVSRNQMQQIYNHYKGSTSHTQQNLRDLPRSRETNSDGRLHVSQINPNINNQIPIEKIGGDSRMNNPTRDQAIYKTGQVVEQFGDAPSAKPFNDLMSPQDPVINRKFRNGLQDMTFTSYPTSAAWSFHGCDRAPPSIKYRHRKRF